MIQGSADAGNGGRLRSIGGGSLWRRAGIHDRGPGLPRGKLGAINHSAKPPHVKTPRPHGRGAFVSGIQQIPKTRLWRPGTTKIIPRFIPGWSLGRGFPCDFGHPLRTRSIKREPTPDGTR